MNTLPNVGVPYTLDDMMPLPQRIEIMEYCFSQYIPIIEEPMRRFIPVEEKKLIVEEIISSISPEDLEDKPQDLNCNDPKPTEESEGPKSEKTDDELDPIAYANKYTIPAAQQRYRVALAKKQKLEYVKKMKEQKLNKLLHERDYLAEVQEEERRKAEEEKKKEEEAAKEARRIQTMITVNKNRALGIRYNKLRELQQQPTSSQTL
jgi:hypothetical protein